jgi:hypothetical protein
MSSGFWEVLELLLRDIITKPQVSHGRRCVRIFCVQEEQDSLAPEDHCSPSCAKSDYLLLQVCPSVCTSAFIRAEFRKLSYSGYLLKSVNTFRFLLKLDEDYKHFTLRPTYVYDLSPWLVFLIESVLCALQAEAEGMLFVTQNVFPLKYELRLKAVNIEHRAWSTLNIAFWHLRDIYRKSSRLRYLDNRF